MSYTPLISHVTIIVSLFSRRTKSLCSKRWWPNVVSSIFSCWTRWWHLSVLCSSIGQVLLANHQCHRLWYPFADNQSGIIVLLEDNILFLSLLFNSWPQILIFFVFFSAETISTFEADKLEKKMTDFFSYFSNNSGQKSATISNWFCAKKKKRL